MITELETGGIPVLLAPSTGPMHAGLVFRVGTVDEPLSRRGITHLVEHLALHSIGVADHHFNGATGPEFTFFHMRGAETDVVGFLNGVCAALRDLPMQRLAVEKEILRTEENSRGDGAGEVLALWRHGAVGYGAGTYPEWGLRGITADDLRGWTARYFNRQNAALWITGSEVPAGLDLDLPDGDRQPVPAPSSALPVRPAWFPGHSNIVAWDAVVPRGAAATVFAGVLERVLFRSLRQESGLSYTVKSDCSTRADGTTVVTALADALPEKQGAVLGAFVDVLAGMRLGLVDEADVTAVVNRRAAEVIEAAENGGRLPGQVFSLLTGQPVQKSDDEFLAGLRAVSRADVVAIAAAATADGLLMTPGRHRADWAGFTAAPTRSTDVVSGKSHQQLGHRSVDEPKVLLTIGADGVTIGTDDDPATVRFDQCVLLLAWPDGARRLIGPDAIQVHFEPTLFRNGTAITAEIDAGLDPALRVVMPVRNPESVPVPRKAPPPPSLGARARWIARNGRLVYSLIFNAVMTLVVGVLAIAGTVALFRDGEFAFGLGAGAVFLGLAGVFGLSLRNTIREIRRS
ncbi:M16 family metallopeptidase [Actinoplanes sp. G11-F43]|uniref:M16 family metallopeptidase n=1 Tax=Actinoplanes sp. G11-F43 TaxID=3424130 RepID=UPI003D32BA10